MRAFVGAAAVSLGATLLSVVPAAVAALDGDDVSEPTATLSGFQAFLWARRLAGLAPQRATMGQ